MSKHVLVFVNAKSGSGEASPERITALFAEHDCTCAVTLLDSHVDLAALARTEPSKIDFIAVGGDGTVNAIASVVAGTERRMGVLALGTLNHFAKDLGLPLKLEEAVEIAAGDHIRRVDVATVNGETFINNSSLGVYPMMVLDRERMKKSGWNKWTSLAVASVKAFARFQCLEVELEVEGRSKRCVTPFLFVGNNEYCMEGTRLGEREHLDRGELSLYLAPGATRATMLRLAFSVLLGRVKQDPEYEEFKVTQFAVNASRGKIRVSLDGEVRRMAGPLQYCIRPHALQVLCPAGEPG